MIIQIRGTSGSGKTTAMRKVMEGYGGTWFKNYIPGRKRPISYTHENGLATVLGSYEATCGGCDGIGSARAVYDVLTDSLHSRYPILLCEGLLLSEDTKWSLQLPDLRVLFLTTPISTCLSQIESRRKKAGNEKPLNPANTSNRVATIERARVKLVEAGVFCRRASFDQTVQTILRWMRQSNG